MRRVGGLIVHVPALDPGESGERRMAVREHGLMALLELNRELGVRIGLLQVVDLVLFNLMGHLGTRKAALWLIDRAGEGGLVLIRGHGVAPAVADTLTTALHESVGGWSAASPPIEVADPGLPLAPEAAGAARGAGLALLGPLAAHGEIIGFVALGRRADGRESSADLEMVRSSLGMAGVAIDNSRLYRELEARNRSLAEANRDLMDLDRMKNEFIQNVNHELRTPLAVISGAADCLLDPPDPDPKRQSMLRAISDQARKLASMVQALLDLGAAAADEEARLETLDLAGLVQSYVFERSARVAGEGHTLTMGPSAAELTARVDPSRLTKALDLLLDNALKFTPQGCRITLAIAPDPDDPAGACLTFADDGPGLRAEQVDRIFRPFYQADGSSTRAAGGLGIGLALVRRLLISMGARIEVDSRPGRGTAFRLRLRKA